MPKAKTQKEIEQPKHIETASEKYRKLKDQRFDHFIDESFTPENLAKSQHFTVTSPSGMEWTMRPLTVDFYTAIGTFPMHLASKVQAAHSAEEVASTLSSIDQERMMELAWKALFYGCIEPRVVVTPQADNEIAMGEILMGDMQFLGEALQKGGKEAERLETFR